MIADSELGAEIGRVLGDESDVTVLPSSLLAEDTDATALTDALAGATHVLYAPQVLSDHFDAESGYGLFNAARKLAAAVDRNGGGAAAVPAHPQCAARR